MNRDVSQLSQAELIERCTLLQQEVQIQKAQIVELTQAVQGNDSPVPKAKNKKPGKEFDASRYATRYVALKFSYLGHQYNGFEHANRCFTPLPTIEEVLWKAMRKARLIDPPIPEGADDTFEVVFDPRERARKYFLYKKAKQEANKVRLDISWEGCQYSKCGRTDRGVSAFGQVIGIRLRSNAPMRTTHPGLECEDAEEGDPDEENSSYDAIRDELPYIYMLNTLLPPDIRIHAWCPSPPEGFDARFSCLERRYKYFFTNPAFCPTPGPLGLIQNQNEVVPIREGWLDIEKMQEAARKLIGLHDYRNFCQIDASKQMPSCERRIHFADVQEVESAPPEIMRSSNFSAHGEAIQLNEGKKNAPGTKVYALVVHGSAFLWHQIRCIAAVLFLVGQGFEAPDVVDKLLDVQANPGRPNYTMADDAPLVLWDCVFPHDQDSQEDGLKWVHAGDEVSIPALNGKSDGKYGPGGLVDELWAQWSEAKVKEAQLHGLLSLALANGDNTSVHRGGFRDPSANKARSMRTFEGAPRPKLQGQYVPLMQRRRMDSLEALNAKYLATTKGARRFPNRLADSAGVMKVNST